MASKNLSNWVVAYNGGADCIEVYCLDKSETEIKSKDDVYLDELIRVIDSMVEKDCSQAQYNVQITEWEVKSIKVNLLFKVFSLLIDRWIDRFFAQLVIF